MRIPVTHQATLDYIERFGLIIVSGGLPLPSDWAGTGIATEDLPDQRNTGTE